LILGFAVAAAVEVRRLFTIHDHRDVDYYLGVPVVALIPETFTPAEKWQSGRSLQKRRLRTLLVGVALVPVLALLFNSLGLFQILATK
jgi:hypothetical protein